MYISVNEAATKFNVSKRRVQVLCEQGRINGATMVGGIWLIPKTAIKPVDARKKHSDEQMGAFDTHRDVLTIDDVCQALSISKATAKNWIRLGKIIPDVGNQAFTSKYIKELKSKIKSSDDSPLKSRRNKKSATGKIIYKDYIHTAENQNLVADLLSLDIVNSEKDLLIILANFAVQLYYQSRNIQFSENNVLPKFLSQNYSDEFHILIKDLIGNYAIDSSTIDRLNPALSKKILFVKGEDSLGFVYISLKDIRQRKVSGTYYTPKKVVKELIDKLYESTPDLKKKTFCDPCCGTGNFILSLALSSIDCGNIYGQDIDRICVFLSRINIALIDPKMPVADIRSRIIVGNTYFETFSQKFDVIVGNPPWGSEFSKEDAIRCRALFKTAIDKGIESYDLFVEKALSMLQDKGVLAFVLPEAILNVSSHTAIRKLILDSCSFKFISYLGNVFTGVQCPAVILGIANDSEKSVVGCRVSTQNDTFVISEPRPLYDTFSFNVSDEENQCLNAISNTENIVYLKGNAKFALGIVTGNNKEYISAEKHNDNELILKGNDIKKYGITASDNYIRFTPESFQQVAPIEIYRAKEKLLYRFICEIPVFAYDNQQTLSLNSCNIIIPEFDDIDIKYILAILNSSVAGFFISKKFNSVKLLRSHIEQIPIPVVSADVQADIIKKVDRIMNSTENISDLYENLDNDIMSLYRLTEKQIATIKSTLIKKNLFLK